MVTKVPNAPSEMWFYTLPYWGVQWWDNLPQPMRSLIESAPYFVDLTCGSGRVPATVAVKKGIPCTINDWNPLVTSHHRMVFCDQELPKEYEAITHRLYPDNVVPVYGRVCQEDKLPLPDETKAYLDGILCQETDVARALVGAFLTSCSFRTYGWSTTTADGGVKLKDITPTLAYTYLLRRLHRAQRSAGKPKATVTVTETDLSQPHWTVPIEPGAVVWADPIWPIPDKPPETYEFLFHIGYLISGVRREPLWWPYGSAYPTQELLRWMSYCAGCGASVFIISTRSDAWPAPYDLFQDLSRHVPPLWIVATKERTLGGKTFTEWWLAFDLNPKPNKEVTHL